MPWTFRWGSADPEVEAFAGAHNLGFEARPSKRGLFQTVVPKGRGLVVDSALTMPDGRRVLWCQLPADQNLHHRYLGSITSVPGNATVNLIPRQDMGRATFLHHGLHRMQLPDVLAHRFDILAAPGSELIAGTVFRPEMLTWIDQAAYGTVIAARPGTLYVFYSPAGRSGTFETYLQALGTVTDVMVRELSRFP